MVPGQILHRVIVGSEATGGSTQAPLATRPDSERHSLNSKKDPGPECLPTHLL